MASKLVDLKSLTDCRFFETGQCVRITQCPHRHCLAAIGQPTACTDWPHKCRSVNCPYKHPEILRQMPMRATTVVRRASSPKGLISFFWDIENVPIPRNQNPFDIVQRIRQKLVIEPGLREDSFNCYCDIRTIPADKQLSLTHANVRMIHVPDRKPNAVDRHIMLDLDRFERIHRPPATIVLISGDIDFVGKLSDLRHQAGYHVIVIHNRPAKEALKNIVDVHYSWDLFTTSNPVFSTSNVPEANETGPGTNESLSKHRRRRSHSRPQQRERSESRPRTNTSKAAPPILANPVNSQAVQELVCPKCPSRFGSIMALRQHQTAKNHLFPCPNCTEMFPTQANLTQHQKAKNHRLTDFRCGQCNRSFAELQSLNQHQQAVGHQPKPPSLGNQDTMKIIYDGIAAIKEVFMRQSPNH